MKTTIILLAVMLASSVAYASGNLRLSVKAAEKESAVVEIANEKLGEVEIDVLNEFGEVIFSKKLVSPVTNYQRKYDFTELEDGNYMLRVQSEKEMNETSFEMFRGTVTITDERKEIEPQIKKVGNIWKLTYLNFPLENMNLYVYEGSRLLHQEEIAPEFAVHKGLDLSGLLPGDYNIVFTNDYNVYEYNVEVR